MQSLVKIGVIVAAHGIRGEVKIRSFISPPEAIFACGTLANASGKKQFTITKRGGNDKAFIASIKDITDRNGAEGLKGTELYASADALPKKKKGDYYSHELIGLEARLESGRVYGRVVQLYDFGAGDIIEIEKMDGKMEMLPLAMPFAHIKKDHVVVHPPEYVEK